MAGAPLGNQNAANPKVWQDAIRRALARKKDGDLKAGVDRLAEKLIESAENGDQWAMLEIGNRLDGKPAQQVQHSGPDGGPIQLAWPLPPTKLDQP